MAGNNSQVKYYITATDKTGAAWKSANSRVQRHRKLLSGIQKPIERAKLALVQFNASLGAMPAASLAGITAGFGALIKAITATGMKLDAFMNSMIVSTGSVTLAHAEMDKIRTLTDTLGLNFLSTADAYKKFSIAASEVGMKSATADKVFRSVAKASSAMGLSAENTRLTLKALEQMISKGTVQSEELRGQLGEHLPGAFGMAAQAMNVTTMQLSKMLEQGEILAVDLLPKLADVLENRFASVAVKASTQARAQFERMKNAWVEFLDALGNAGVYKTVKSHLVSITDALETMRDQLNAGIPQGKLEREFRAISAIIKLYKVWWLQFVDTVVSKMIEIDQSFNVFRNMKSHFLLIKAMFIGVVSSVLDGMQKIDNNLTKLWNSWAGGNRQASQMIAGYAALTAAQYRDAQSEARRFLADTSSGVSELKELSGGVKESLSQAITEWRNADNLFRKPIDAGIESARDFKQELVYAQLAMTDLLGENDKPFTIFDDFSNERFMRELREMNREVRDITQLSADFVDRFADGLGDQLANALATGKMNFSDFARSILLDINKLIIKALIWRAIMGVAKFIGNLGSAPMGAPVNSSAVSPANPFLGTSASPLAMSPVAPVSALDLMGKAGGGSVSGGRAIIVGEQGREVFVPDSDGQIVPNHNINKSHPVNNESADGDVTVVLNLSTGVQQTVRAEVMGMMPVITKQVKGAVAEARQRGGSFSNKMGIA